MTNVVTFSGTREPSKREIRARTNLVYQLWRFIVLNIKMLKMVSKGHH